MRKCLINAPCCAFTLVIRDFFPTKTGKNIIVNLCVITNGIYLAFLVYEWESMSWPYTLTKVIDWITFWWDPLQCHEVSWRCWSQCAESYHQFGPSIFGHVLSLSSRCCWTSSLQLCLCEPQIFSVCAWSNFSSQLLSCLENFVYKGKILENNNIFHSRRLSPEISFNSV